MNKIKIKYLPILIFVLFSIKFLALGTTWPEVGALFIIASLSFLYEFKLKNEEIVEINKKIEELANSIKEQDKGIEENRAYITSLKMNSNNGGRRNGFSL